MLFWIYVIGIPISFVIMCMTFGFLAESDSSFSIDFEDDSEVVMIAVCSFLASLIWPGTLTIVLLGFFFLVVVRREIQRAYNAGERLYRHFKRDE